MHTIVSCRPETGEPLLARTTQRVRSRAFAIAAATGAIIDPGASKRHSLLGDTIVMPFANLALMGTNCARPLKFEDGERIAREVGLDVVLMRYDIDRGASFDILDQQGMFWRCPS